MSASFYADPEVEKSRSRLIATRRIGEVSDIANAVMFLASKRSDLPPATPSRSMAASPI